MTTIKKSKTKLKKAQAGVTTDPRTRQGNAPASTSTSSGINTGPRTALATPKVAERAETFGQAFAANRKAGAKTFSYKGKSYTTATADDNKSKVASVNSNTKYTPESFHATKVTTPSPKPAAKGPIERGSSYNPPETFSKHFPKKSGVPGMKKGGVIKSKKK